MLLDASDESDDGLQLEENENDLLLEENDDELELEENDDSDELLLEENPEEVDSDSDEIALEENDEGEDDDGVALDINGAIADMPTLSATTLRESGNAAFRSGAHAEAIQLYSQALMVLTDEDERASVLVNRSNAHNAVADYTSSRRDARTALRLRPKHIKALFRLSVAEGNLGRPAWALAALAAGAMRGQPSDFASFSKQARAMGAWRLPPPLTAMPPPTSEVNVHVLDGSAGGAHSVTRADFMPFVERGEPVIIRGFADITGWSWDGLIQRARDAEQRGHCTSGDVLVTASGVVPDYQRGKGAPHASQHEVMVQRTTSLVELLERVSHGDALAHTYDVDEMPKAVAAHKVGEHAPLLCAREKVYSYGKCWMLGDDGLRAQCEASWPTFIERADLSTEEDKAGAQLISTPSAALAGEEVGEVTATNPSTAAPAAATKASHKSKKNSSKKNKPATGAAVVEPTQGLVGRRVTINGLASKPELNGTHGLAISFDDAKGRYNVKLDATGSLMALKPTALAAADDTAARPNAEGVCWVGSAGCLTPLHYDLSDGLLAQALGEKRVWLFHPDAMDNCYLRSPRRPGHDNWERQSMASLHGEPANDWPQLRRATRFLADLRPGDCLFIPSQWLHEVHSRTASFSLGWRVAMAISDPSAAAPGSGGKEGVNASGAPTRRLERNPGQKLERLASSVKSGKMSMEASLAEALQDPSMMQMLQKQMPELTKQLDPVMQQQLQAAGGLDFASLAAAVGGGGGLGGLGGLGGTLGGDGGRR